MKRDASRVIERGSLALDFSLTVGGHLAIVSGHRISQYTKFYVVPIFGKHTPHAIDPFIIASPFNCLLLEFPSVGLQEAAFSMPSRYSLLLRY